MSTVSDRPSATQHSALHRFGLWLVRHATAVLIVSGVLLVAAAALGTTAFGRLQAGGFEDPGRSRSWPPRWPPPTSRRKPI